jgi:hypothetical protein
MKKFSLILFACVVIAAFTAGTSRAKWYWTHGHSGHPAQSSAVQADGLQVASYDNPVWVHYAVPTIGEADHKVRYIKVRYTLTNYAGITNIGAIHLYNGETKVKEFNSGWPPIVYTGPQLHEVTFDLESAMVFDRGLGVSIFINSDMNSGGESLVIHGVGANFAPASASSASYLLLLE